MPTASLASSLLRNMLSDKGATRAGEGTIRAGKGRDFYRCLILYRILKCISK